MRCAERGVRLFGGWRWRWSRILVLIVGVLLLASLLLLLSCFGDTAEAFGTGIWRRGAAGPSVVGRGVAGGGSRGWRGTAWIGIGGRLGGRGLG